MKGYKTNAFFNYVQKMTILFIIFFMVIFDLYPQTLWQKTEFGMTVEQVKKLYPNVVVPDKRGTLNDGAKELLKLKNIEIVNRLFDISFYFKNNHLNQVTVECIELNNQKDSETTYSNLEQVLNLKYGDKFSSNKENGDGIIVWNCIWMSEKTNISLNYLNIDGIVVLNVVYQLRLMEEANKL